MWLFISEYSGGLKQQARFCHIVQIFLSGSVSVFGQLTQAWGEGPPLQGTYMDILHGWQVGQSLHLCWEMSSAGKQVCLLAPGSPIAPSYGPDRLVEWLHHRRVVLSDGRFTLSALIFLATFQLEVTLWSSSGQWNVSRSQAAGWSFWESFLPSLSKGSLSADRPLHPSSFFLFLPRLRAWYLEVQLPSWDHEVLKQDEDDNMLRKVAQRGQKVPESLTTPVSNCISFEPPISRHTLSSGPHKSIIIEVTRVGFLLLSVECAPNWGHRFSGDSLRSFLTWE